MDNNNNHLVKSKSKNNTDQWTTLKKTKKIKLRICIREKIDTLCERVDPVVSEWKRVWSHWGKKETLKSLNNEMGCSRFGWKAKTVNRERNDMKWNVLLFFGFRMEGWRVLFVWGRGKCVKLCFCFYFKKNKK
jgi:hypothetical protein